MASRDEGVARSRRDLITGSLAGAGLMTGAAILGQAAPALADTPGLTVIPPSSDATAAIQAALDAGVNTGGSQVLLLPGDYHITAPITMHSNQRLIGAGAGATKIIQDGAGDGIVSVGGASVNYVTIAGLTLMGTQAAGSCGIRLAPAGVPFTNLTNITIEDCVVTKWGDTGVHLAAPIASRITRVQSSNNLGDGFYIGTADPGTGPKDIKTATSLTFDACYALGNAKNGYELDTVSYSTLTGCAADCGTGTRGYALWSCYAVTLTSCGAEEFSKEGFLVQSGTSCALYGAYTFGGGTVGIHLAGTTVQQTIGGAVQRNPGSLTTNFILADDNTSVVVWGVSRPGTIGTSTDTFAGHVVNLDGSA